MGYHSPPFAVGHPWRRRIGHPHQGHHRRRRCHSPHSQVPDRQEGRRTDRQKGLRRKYARPSFPPTTVFISSPKSSSPTITIIIFRISCTYYYLTASIVNHRWRSIIDFFFGPTFCPHVKLPHLNERLLWCHLYQATL